MPCCDGKGFISASFRMISDCWARKVVITLDAMTSGSPSMLPPDWRMLRACSTFACLRESSVSAVPNAALSSVIFWLATVAVPPVSVAVNPYARRISATASSLRMTSLRSAASRSASHAAPCCAASYLA